MSDTMGATQTLNAPPSATATDPALNPQSTPITVSSSDLNPPAVPAALASDPAYNAYIKALTFQGATNQNQADEQTAFLKANLASNLPEIQRRGDIATAATKNAFSQRGTLASSWAGNALTTDATNTAQGLQAAKDTELASETGIQQSLAASKAAQAQGAANEALTVGTALGSGPATAGSAANTAATPQLVTPNAAAAGATTTQQSVVIEAGKYVGGPYQWGGGHSGSDVPPGSPVDCSGLVQQVYADNGITFTGTAATMQQQAAKVPNLAAAQPGDLIFYGMPAYHVGIYIGNGQMISAQDPADGVKTSPVGTPTSIGRVVGVGPAGGGQLATGAAATTGAAGTATAAPAPDVSQASPIPGQPNFQVPAALASSPAWLNYLRTMTATEATNANTEQAKLAAIQTAYGTANPAGQQLTPGTVQNQLTAQLPNILANTSNTQSQRGTLASSWGQQALTNDRYSNAFSVSQANQAGLGQTMAARQALAQTYAGDQQKLVAEALNQAQILASNPATAGSTANAAATPVTPTGTNDLSGWISQAATTAGVPASWIAGLTSIAQHESGGNPTAVNRTDSNAQAGHPSQGLMQMIPSTFAAYAVPGHTDINNPVDNLLAAIGYIKARYGDISNVPGIKALAAGGSYVGY